MRICFATCAEMPNGIEDDRPVIEELQARGHSVEYRIWNDPLVDWRFFNKVVIRSTWDYHYHIHDFIRWIDRVSSQAELLNSKDVFVWNYDKKYLQELAKNNVAMAENFIFSERKAAHEKALALLKEKKKIILKPTISASAHLTFLIEDAAKIDAALERIFKKSEAMVQPFYESVLTDGEVSLLFFNKKYSHAVLKKSLSDFRVQSQFGGEVSAHQASAELIAFAEKVLKDFKYELPYARVDVLDWKNSPKISELELIEPELFFRMSPAAVKLFTDVVINV